MRRNYVNRGLNKRVTKPNNTKLDTHEILKKEILSDIHDSGSSAHSSSASMAQSRPTQSSPAQSHTNVVQAPQIIHVPTPSGGSPPHGIEDIYLHLDSLTKDRTADEYTLQFRISNLNNSRPIENIVSIRLGEFYLPRLVSEPGRPDYFFYRRVYMDFSNLPTNQGYRGSSIYGSLTKHHFELEIDNTNSIAVTAKPVAPTFYFAQPLSTLDQLTIKFMIPPYWGNVRLPPDTVEAQVVPGSNPARLQLLGDAVTTDLTHLTGVLPQNERVAIYMIRFASDDATANNQMNSPYGIFIDEVIDNKTFSISSASFANVTATDGPVRFIIAKNRITIPLRITTITGKVTNHLFPVHH